MNVLYFRYDHKELPPNYTGVIQKQGCTYWYLRSKPHRTEGHAIEWNEGRSRAYFLNSYSIGIGRTIILVTV